METVLVVVVGLIVLGLFYGVAHVASDGDSRRVARACRLFIPVWLFLSLVNMYIGVVVAGYYVLPELVVLAVVFGIPAAVAWWLDRRFGDASGT